MNIKSFTSLFVLWSLFIAMPIASCAQQKSAVLRGEQSSTDSSKGQEKKPCQQPARDAYHGVTINFYPTTRMSHCPVELVLTDPLGRRTGFDPTTNSEYNEDPNAGYDNAGTDTDEGPGPETTKKIQTSASIDGDYTVIVKGTGIGNYSAEFRAFYNYSGYSEAGFATLKNIAISSCAVHTYTIHYENRAGVTSTLSGGFDGGGQRPKDVNKFLTYANPSDSQTDLPAGTTTFPLMIFCGNSIITSTFKASLNGVDISSLFNPTPGSHETININLVPGRNVLLLSTDGNLPNRVATDTDRLVFIVK